MAAPDISPLGGAAVPWRPVARYSIMRASRDVRMRDWLLVLLPVGFVLFWIIYPEKVSGALFWLMSFFR